MVVAPIETPVTDSKSGYQPGFDCEPSLTAHERSLLQLDGTYPQSVELEVGAGVTGLTGLSSLVMLNLYDP